MEGLVERRILPIAIERCEESPVVLLEGPRTVGKSTLLRTMAERLGGRFSTSTTLLSARPWHATRPR